MKTKPRTGSDKLKRKKIIRRLIRTLAAVFILVNVVAFFHAYKFTHFASASVTRTKDAQSLSTGDKLLALFFGISNPRPTNKLTPAQKYKIITLQSNKSIECWSIESDSAKGSVILFHGYGGNKSAMLDKSDEFLKLGYNTLLVDFMGSGGSEGNQTTLGYKEAEEVQTCYDFLSRQGEKNIILFGTSMGAVAILKAIQDYKLQPKAIIIECPFGTMYKTTCARFKALGVPSFPLAGLLDLWGGIQNGFWAFSHNPNEYAKSVQCPTLLLYGGHDAKVSRQEIDEIFSNLNGKKQLKTYPLAGHENYLTKYKQQWINDIDDFLKQTVK